MKTLAVAKWRNGGANLSYGDYKQNGGRDTRRC
jgi:hypothetical protein